MAIVILRFRRPAGCRSLVGRIPAGSLENNPDRGKHLTQTLLPALRTAGERFVGETLHPVESHPAIATLIRVYRHRVSSIPDRLLTPVQLPYYTPELLARH